MSDHHDHSHHGHSHGGDDPPWYRRLLFAVGMTFIIVFAACLIGVKLGWLK